MASPLEILRPALGAIGEATSSYAKTVPRQVVKPVKSGPMTSKGFQELNNPTPNMGVAGAPNALIDTFNTTPREL